MACSQTKWRTKHSSIAPKAANCKSKFDELIYMRLCFSAYYAIFLAPVNAPVANWGDCRRHDGTQQFYQFVANYLFQKINSNNIIKKLSTISSIRWITWIKYKCNLFSGTLINVNTSLYALLNTPRECNNLVY